MVESIYLYFLKLYCLYKVSVMAAYNPNAIVQMTMREKLSLESKAKYGWRCYFIQRSIAEELSITRANSSTVVQQIRNGETPDTTHLTNLFLDLYDKCGELCSCPVCFDSLTKSNTFLPLCGHLLCNECKGKVSICPVCRNNF